MPRLNAQQVIAGLVQRGVPEHVAQGVVMNFQDESGLDTGIQEQAPRGGRGGFGLAQWTGPRRVALENYAAFKGKPIDDPDLQLDFFMNENAGPEKAAWDQVVASPDRTSAATAFVNKWERPAAEHAALRSAKYANAGDSPSESGGARFGGGGLDATSTPETAFGQPADSKSPYSLPKQEDKYGKIAEAAAGALQGFGGGSAPQLGGGRAPLPAVAPVGAAPVQTITSGGGGDQNYRDAMARIMASLNSGQIWG